MEVKVAEEAATKPQERSREFKEASRMPQIGPKRFEGCSPEATKRAQEDPKRRQERPK